MGATADGIYFNTDSGLTPLLDRLTATVDQNAVSRAQQRAMALGSIGGLTPADAPAPSVFSQILGNFGFGGSPSPSGQPAPATPPSVVSSAPSAPSSLPAFAASQGTPTSVSPNAQAALNFYQSKGLSPVAAAGLVGGFANESGGKLNTAAANPGDGADGSTSSGIGQWNGARGQALAQFAAAKGTSPNDLQTQLEFSWSELTGPERATLDKLQSATNPLQATVAALGYERPAGWSPSNPLGAKTFGSRLASTNGLASGAPVMAYAPAGGGGADGAPAQAAITSATGGAPQASAPIATASPSAQPSPFGSLANVPAALTAQQPQQQPAAPPQQQMAGGLPPSPTNSVTPSMPTPATMPLATADSGSVAQNAQPQAQQQQPTPSAPAAAAPLGGPGTPGTPQQPSLDQIRQLVLEPTTRALGLQLWQQYLTPKDGFTLSAGQQRFAANGRPIAAVAGDPVTVAPGSTLASKTGRPLYQAPPNLELKQTGEDLYGNKAFGTFDPQSGKVGAVAPAGGQAGGSTIASDPTVHGDDYLSSLPAGLAAQVKSYGDYKQKLPTGVGANSPFARQLRTAVLQYNPDFDAAAADSRFKTAAAFKPGGGPSSPGMQVLAGQTAIGHLGELSDAAGALNNFDTGIPGNSFLNYGRNAYLGSSGQSTAIKEFQLTRDKAVEELTKFYRGSGGAESDLKRDIDNVSTASSPPELAGSIYSLASLAMSKTQGLQNTWHNGMDVGGKSEADFPIMTPANKMALNTIAQRAGKPAFFPEVSRASGAPTPTAAPATAPAPAQPADTSPIGQARAAIAAGAPRDQVLQRLQQHGVDFSGQGL